MRPAYGFLAVLAVLLVMPPPAHAQRVVQPRVKTDYNKTTDATTVALVSIPDRQNALSVAALYECRGRDKCAPAAVQVVLVAQNPQPKYEKSSGQVGVHIDDAAALTYAMEYRPMPDPSYAGSVREVLTWIMPADDFVRAANAAKLAVAISEESVLLGREQQRGLALLAKEIEKVRAKAAQ